MSNTNNEKYISIINVNETEYLVKDAKARADISNIDTDIKSKLDKNTDTEVSGVFNFVNGIQINGVTVAYDKVTDTVVFI